MSFVGIQCKRRAPKLAGVADEKRDHFCPESSESSRPAHPTERPGATGSLACPAQPPGQPGAGGRELGWLSPTADLIKKNGSPGTPPTPSRQVLPRFAEGLRLTAGLWPGSRQELGVGALPARKGPRGRRQLRALNTLWTPAAGAADAGGGRGGLGAKGPSVVDGSCPRRPAAPFPG